MIIGDRDAIIGERDVIALGPVATIGRRQPAIELRQVFGRDENQRLARDRLNVKVGDLLDSPRKKLSSRSVFRRLMGGAGGEGHDGRRRTDSPCR